MRPALILIDVQHDFLSAPGLTPPRGLLVGAIARLLDAWRTRRLPVAHVHTTIDDPSRAMPHWVAAGVRRCVRGTPGHATPEPLAPLPDEPVIDKTFFSAFSSDVFERRLAEHDIDTLVLAGIHTHGCVRSTALDAYQRGFRVLLAEDAIGGYDALHAEQSLVYLHGRAAQRISSARILTAVDGKAGLDATAIDAPGEIIHASPAARGEVRWRIAMTPAHELHAFGTRAGEARAAMRQRTSEDHLAWMARVADAVESRADVLARQISLDVGKPITEAEGEVRYALDLVRAAARFYAQPWSQQAGPGLTARRVPRGVVAVITPWNNPLAIPLGKLVPAIAYGNAVIWKPAPQGAALAQAVLDVLIAADTPTHAVQLVQGGADLGRALMGLSAVDAMTITGSLRVGVAAQLACAARMIPLQAELGGNNAAVIWHDADLPHAAAAIAHGAFAFAGQRCTATRRVIVPAALLDSLVEHLRAAAATLPLGDPLDARTVIGPVIDDDSQRRIESAIAQAATDGAQVHRISPDGDTLHALSVRGSYVAPAIVICEQSNMEIVQQETFGPVLVVQPADDWDHALSLCNDVSQGLAAALFTQDDALWEAFTDAVQVGMLKRNQSTAGASADLPFAGCKTSGLGPPEHADGDRAFYTRVVAVYERP